MLKYLFPFSVIVLSATLATAQTVTTKVETTTMISTDKMNEATFMQLIGAIRSFHGQEITLSGTLKHFMDDTFWFYAGNNEKFDISIDDGRSVKKKSLQCTLEAPCSVSMTIELAVNSDYGHGVYLNGVGYDLEFLN
tara:strand:+ start:886 stop:1296 length:411 start_codon:yes stop_codon:yes gene_type:complete